MPDQVIQNAASSRLYTVTELATALGVTARALRFYEDKGLISPSRAGGARIYAHRDRARLQLILRGKRLGFTLRDIKEFLDLYDVDPGHQEQQRRLLKAVRKRIAHLSSMKDAITETVRELAEIERQVASTLRQ